MWLVHSHSGGWYWRWDYSLWTNPAVFKDFEVLEEPQWSSYHSSLIQCPTSQITFSPLTAPGLLFVTGEANSVSLFKSNHNISSNKKKQIVNIWNLKVIWEKPEFTLRMMPPSQICPNTCDKLTEEKNLFCFISLHSSYLLWAPAVSCSLPKPTVISN